MWQPVQAAGASAPMSMSVGVPPMAASAPSNVVPGTSAPMQPYVPSFLGDQRAFAGGSTSGVGAGAGTGAGAGAGFTLLGGVGSGILGSAGNPTNDYGSFRRASGTPLDAASIAADDADSFMLPIGHRVSQDFESAGTDVAKVDEPISASNVGYKMLQRMGWDAGHGLGKDGRGITEPIKVTSSSHMLGLGKLTEYLEMSAEAAKERKKLEVEIEETEAVKRRRQETKEAIETRNQELSAINRPFYCEICDKQYKHTMEFQNHLSSYDHHHTKRFKETQAMNRAAKALSSRESSKKQRQREERELQRQMAAAGVKPPSIPGGAGAGAGAGVAAAPISVSASLSAGTNHGGAGSSLGPGDVGGDASAAASAAPAPAPTGIKREGNAPVSFGFKLGKKGKLGKNPFARRK